MRLYLDTEFNGLGGELISMALVVEDGRLWYGVKAIPDRVNAWVAKHVLPFLQADPLGPVPFQDELGAFLRQFDGCEIIADWPADFEHLGAEMSQIGAQAGFKMPIECTMRLINSPPLTPRVPHNALSDALALREWHMQSALSQRDA